MIPIAHPVNPLLRINVVPGALGCPAVQDAGTTARNPTGNLPLCVADDWSSISERYEYVGDLEGSEFWHHAAQWVAELGDAHTQLIHPSPRSPYLACRLRRVGASPHHHALVAGRRSMAMTRDRRRFTAVAPNGDRHSWTETHRHRASVVAMGNWLPIDAFTPDVPERTREAFVHADRDQQLTIDLCGNAGGSLGAAAEARRLFVRDEGPLVGLPHVSIDGGPTGGGSGRSHTRLIKDGVRLAVSTAITYTRDRQPIGYQGIQSTVPPSHR